MALTKWSLVVSGARARRRTISRASLLARGSSPYSLKTRPRSASVADSSHSAPVMPTPGFMRMSNATPRRNENPRYSLSI